MSLQGEINKYAGEINRAINSIAKGGMVNSLGTPLGTEKIIGYVCSIHTEGELAGTIDVQEYNCQDDDLTFPGAGHHEGVLLSAIQNNENGCLIVPQLFSEVIIIKNPYDGNEYVLMYSHAKKIKWLAHSNKSDDDGEIEIGVTEVEDFVETDDGLDKDFNELEPTKNKTSTNYTSKNISHQVISPDNKDGFKEELTAEQKSIKVKGTTIIIDGEKVVIETTKAVSFKIGQTEITNENDKIAIKTNEYKIEAQTNELKGTDIKIDGSNVKITGGNLTVQGTCTPDMNGPFNDIAACPFSGAPHCGSIVSGT